jgi:hypothetical protein
MNERPTDGEVRGALRVLRTCRGAYGANNLDDIMVLLELWSRESEEGKRRVAEETLRIQRENEERIERVPE